MIQHGTRALIVDDDPFVREMLGMILQGAGCDVEVAQDGGVALELVFEGRLFDIIVSDMNMPGISGLELINNIRSRGSDVPIVILTGDNEISVAVEALRSGANDYLLKDENIQDTIIISVERVLEKYQLKVQNERLVKELASKNARLERDRVLANKVQHSILPQGLKFTGFEIGTFYRASDQIGGDFYDAWESERHLHILVGDISGHSTSSALMMAVCKGLLNSIGQTVYNPRDIATLANRKLSEIMGESGMFLSMFLCSYDKGTGVMDYISAGHNPVYLRTASGTTVTLESTGPVIGWDAGDTWDAVSYPLGEGDMVFLYTDGLTEAKNREEHEFGEDALMRLIDGRLSPEELIKNMYNKVNEYTGGVFEDDLTMFAFKKVSTADDARDMALTLKPEFTEVDRARDAIAAAIDSAFADDANSGLRIEFVLAASEAMNNAVEHSGSPSIGVALRIMADAARLVVTTSGKRFDPTAISAVMPAGEEFPEGGYGLAIIAEVIDDFEYSYRDGINQWTLTKYFISGGHDD